ncbi:YaaA family protein [Curtobacterium sp. RRHDQ10]|uniref:YaaA family protein n=1 Tax=Curtobacterium phyllosphaerae TaxID=3413379 RepID=UPI003BF2CDB8
MTEDHRTSLTVLLPPSETKREGGDEDRPFDLGALAFPELTGERVAAIAAARSVSSDEATARRALKLGPRSVGERFRNLVLEGAPSLPAVERYTGVLYDPLGAAGADPATTAWWADHVVVQSAMFGPVAAGDRLPAYRLSHDSRLGALRLATLWPAAVTPVLERRTAGGLVLDLRSEGYRALGPLDAAVPLRVVSEGTDGRRRALNHWNKTAKGRLVRLLGTARPEVDRMTAFRDWARSVGVVVDEVDGVWELVAESLAPTAR